MPPDPSKKAHYMEACPHYLACTQTDGLQLSHFYLHVSFAVYDFMSEGPGMHIYGSNPGPIPNFPFCLSIYNSVCNYIYNTVIILYLPSTLAIYGVNASSSFQSIY